MFFRSSGLDPASELIGNFKVPLGSKETHLMQNGLIIVDDTLTRKHSANIFFFLRFGYRE